MAQKFNHSRKISNGGKKFIPIYSFKSKFIYVFGTDDSSSREEMRFNRRSRNGFRRSPARSLLETFVRESILRAGDILSSLRSVDRMLIDSDNDDSLERSEYSFPFLSSWNQYIGN